MKRMFKGVIAAAVALVAVVAMGCKNSLVEEDEFSSFDGSCISARISELKDAGLFDSILLGNSGRSADDEGESLSQMRAFIASPDDYIAQNSDGEDEDGEKLISAILSGSSVAEVYSIMYSVSSEMAEDFLENIKSAITDMDCAMGRSAMPDSDIMSLALGFADSCPAGTTSRSIFQANLNQDTINWYYGMCAATIAGLSAYKFCGWWQPWVGVAGLVAAGAGATSMVTQLTIWSTCTEFSNWVSALAGNNSYETSAILNSGVGPKILGISAATAGVVAYCVAVTPKVAGAIVNAVKVIWNKIIVIITRPLPTGVTLIINGVKLVAL